MAHLPSSPAMRTNVTGQNHGSSLDHLHDGHEQQPQERLYAAYAVLHEVHARAAELLDDSYQLFAAHYSRIAAQTSRTDQRRLVEDLLYAFTTMQTTLTAATTPASTTRRGEEEESGDRMRSHAEVREACAYLHQCLPEEWREWTDMSSTGARCKSGASKKKASSTAPVVPSTTAAAGPATQQQQGEHDEFNTKHTASPAQAATSPETGTHNALASNTSVVVLSCPADIVQLALLLRRHWTLQRDITLSIPALLDMLTELDERDMSDNVNPRNNNNNNAKSNPPATPSVLSASTVLAVMQLTRASDLDGEAAAAATSQGEQTGTTSPSTTAITMLPLLLWQAYRADQGAPEPNEHTPHPQQRQGSSNADSVASCSTDAVAAQSYTTARQLTKKIYKWEAHMAAYVTAQLSKYADVAFDDSRRSGSSIAYMTSDDVTFLTSTQQELTVVRGACNSAQLLWMTIQASLLHPVSVKASAGAALGDVTKRCTKLEASLRTLQSTSTVARLLLPGVLLWLGECLNPSSHINNKSGSARPDAANSTPEATQRGYACWQQAYTLSAHDLGRTHPFVEAMAKLVSPPPALSSSPPATKRGTAAASVSAVLAAPAQTARRPSTPLIPTSLTARPTATHFALPSASSSAFTADLPAQRLPPVSQLPPPRTAATAPAHRLPPSPPPQPRSGPSSEANSGSAGPPLVMLARPPDTSRAFATAFSSPRYRPGASADGASRPPPPPAFAASERLLPGTPASRLSTSLQGSRGTGGGGGAGAATAASQLGSTFPPSAAAPASADGDPFRSTPPPPPSAAAAAASAAVQRVPQGKFGRNAKGLAALRNCHRLAHPEDAFALRGTVKDAVYDDDLANQDTLNRRNGKKKKKNKKGKKGNNTASTEALLLSASAAAAGESMTSTDGDAASRGAYEQSRRRRRPDRTLLPPIPAAVPRTNSVHTSKQEEGEQKPQLAPPTDSAFVPFDDAEKPFWSATDAPDGGPASSLSAKNSVRSKKNASFRGPASSEKGVSSPRNNGDVDEGDEEDEDDEEDEEDYDNETLPERNARLQREMRTFFAQLNTRRVRAAAIIQRAWRCSQARQTLRIRQQLLYRYVYIIQQAAVLAIEGFVLCVWEQRKRRAALQARQTAAQARAAQERRELAAAQVLTRAARQWGVRQRERRRMREQLNIARDAKLRLYEVTAVLVQRWWRSIVPQKAYWRHRTAQVEEQQRQQAEADRLARAATTIQTRVRGAQARTRVDELRRTRAAEAHALRLQRDAAVTAITIALQEHVRRQARVAREARERHAQQEQAVHRIAESWRATLERRRVDAAVQRARQLQQSATCLQRAWRRYSAARQRRYLRQTQRTVQEDRLADELTQWTSVMIVQCVARSALDQLHVQALKARAGRTFMEGVIYLQSVCRGGQVRAALGQARHVELARRRVAAAALAQRQHNAACAVQAALRAHHSAVHVRQQRRADLKEKLHVYTTAAREMRQDAAATVLQRAVRRHQQRQRSAAADAEAAVALAYLNGMATRVQRMWRGVVARRQRRRRAAAVRACAVKRQEAEDVMELVWRDQHAELDVLLQLERHYIAEAEHRARMALYRRWASPTSSAANAADVAVDKRSTTKASGTARKDEPDAVDSQGDGSDAVDRWAALYVD